jgi:serine protease DegQ
MRKLKKLEHLLFLIALVSLSLTMVFWLQTRDYSSTAKTILVPSLQNLQKTADQITVRILAKKETIGSGILLFKQNSTYTILTNDHVLRAADPPYRVQTFDNQSYPANVTLRQSALGGNDLAVLELYGVKTDYRVARLERVVDAAAEVFAAGFPLTSNVEEREVIAGVAFRRGKISLKLPQALEGGYQVGYTNQIDKGMSGGPLLDRSGRVIAINGMHAEPLWGDPYVYRDGSRPAAHLNLSQYSWGIPIATIEAEKLNPQNQKLVVTN